MPFFDFTYASSTGKNELHAAICKPEGSPRGVVHLVHGLAEHTGRYADFMQFLAGKGFVTAGNDHLGHGSSVSDSTELGSFADHDGWDHVVRDTLKFRAILKEQNPELPYIVLGHSMGSFIVRTCLINDADFCSGAILSGTAHPSSALLHGGTAAETVLERMNKNDLDEHALYKNALKKYSERIDNPRTEYDWITRDPEQVEAFLADEKCAFIPKKDLFLSLLHGLTLITDPDQIKKMNRETPILFLSGKEDPVGEYGKGVSRAYDAFCRAGMHNVTLRLYPGGRHEMLHELNRVDVENDILSWIEQMIL